MKNYELGWPPYEATEILLWALRAQINTLAEQLCRIESFRHDVSTARFRDKALVNFRVLLSKHRSSCTSHEKGFGERSSSLLYNIRGLGKAERGFLSEVAVPSCLSWDCHKQGNFFTKFLNPQHRLYSSMVFFFFWCIQQTWNWACQKVCGRDSSLQTSSPREQIVWIWNHNGHGSRIGRQWNSIPSKSLFCLWDKIMLNS